MAQGMRVGAALTLSLAAVAVFVIVLGSEESEITKSTSPQGLHRSGLDATVPEADWAEAPESAMGPDTVLLAEGMPPPISHRVGEDSAVVASGSQDLETPREVVFGKPEDSTRAEDEAEDHGEEEDLTKADDKELMPPLEVMPPSSEEHLKTQYREIANETTSAPTMMPTTAVPTAMPTTAAPTATPTALPTAQPTTPPPTPVRCADCIGDFVRNKGCALWKQRGDPKAAVSPACAGADSPLLTNYVCESKLAHVCGMHNKPTGLGREPEAMKACSTSELAELQSGENGHLGCAPSGGSCAVNVGVPECHCKKGFSGRACDVGPRANANATVAPEVLLAMDLVDAFSKTGGLDSCKNGHNIMDSETTTVTKDKTLKMTQGSALQDQGTVNFVVLEALETVGWIEQFQYEEVDIGADRHMVHLGFWQAIGPHLAALGKQISDKLGDTKSVIVAGYGQAGAVANILALYLQKAHGKEVTLITYGAPRTGDFAFAKAVSSLHKVQRIVRAGDPYTVVPTTSCKDYFRCLGGEMPFIFYVHAGQQITLPAKHASMCDHPTFHDEGKDGGLGHIHKLRQSADAKQCFSQHSVDGYVQGVAKQVPKTTKHYICTAPSFVPLPPPPPPPAPVVKTLYIRKPPPLADWNVRGKTF